MARRKIGMRGGRVRRLKGKERPMIIVQNRKK